MAGRELTLSEVKNYIQLERELSILHWGVAKASHYTATCQDLTCYLHSSDQLTLIRSNQAHLRLWAAVLNLQMYGAKWAVADKKVGFDGKLAKALHADTVVPDAQGGVPYVEHKDVTLNMVKRGAARIKVGKVKMQGKYRAYFDGGKRKSKAGGGYTVLSPEGKWVAGEAMYYGKGVTNNEAEGKACLAALESLEGLVEKHPSVAMEGVVLLGDS